MVIRMEKAEVIKLLGKRYSHVVFRRAANDKYNKFAGFITTDKIRFPKLFLGLFEPVEVEHRIEYKQIPLKDITKNNIFKYESRWKEDKKRVYDMKIYLMRQLNILQQESRSEGYKPFGLVFS